MRQCHKSYSDLSFVLLTYPIMLPHFTGNYKPCLQGNRKIVQYEGTSKKRNTHPTDCDDQMSIPLSKRRISKRPNRANQSIFVQTLFTSV